MRDREGHSQWIRPMLLLGVTSLALVACLIAIDHTLVNAGFSDPLSHYLSFSDESVSNSIGVLSSIIAAVLGIVITVVSIVVQLSATRYTPAITEIFFRDRINQVVMAFYVVGCISGFWIAFAVGDGWVPRVSLVVMLSTATLCFLLMAPYFAHVFRLLSPKRVVSQIMDEAKEAIIKSHKFSTARSKDVVLTRVEHLCDIAINSMSQKDRIIAIASVDSLRDLALAYLEHKSNVSTDWFEADKIVRHNPDFSSMAKDSLQDIQADHTWFEFKILRQYQSIYYEALGSMAILNHVIAINTRLIAEKALEHDDIKALDLSIKFFNTYLRATINANDVRTAYTILNQYRLIVEAVLQSPHQEHALKMVGHMQYYGHLSYEKKLGFVTETIAYDIAEVCELANTIESPIEGALLSMLLDVDPKTSDGDIQETSLRGVRKAQLKLASYYLDVNQHSLAKQVWADMRDEPRARLDSIHQELLSITSKDFWEISDRGGHFDFLPPARKKHLSTFFGWFENNEL